MHRMIILTSLLVLTAGCCIFPPPIVPPPLDPIEEPRHPAVIANRIELLLTQDTPIRDKSKSTSLRMELKGQKNNQDFRRVWSAFVRRLTSRNKHLWLAAETGDHDLRLVATVGRKDEKTILHLELFKAGEAKPIWSHGELIILDKE